jgi:signal transduction histidine kinase
MQSPGRLSVFGLSFFAGLVGRAGSNFARSVQEFEPNFRWMGLSGAFCFVFYYVVWNYCFPQPYENLPLRLVGTLLAVGLAMSDRWPPLWRRRYLTPYAYLTLLYVFPFFFTYMLLQNQGGSVWAMSTLVACFLMILLVDVVNLILMQCAGAVCALALYFATGPEHPELPFLHSRELLLFVFLILMGSVFNIRAEMMRREKSRAMLLMGARMAHEMRTPLAGIKIGLAGLSRMLDQDAARSEDVRMFKEQIIAQANHAGTIIDMLLLNANRESPAHEKHDLRALLFADLLQTTLANFPFVSPAERAMVRIAGDFRFYVFGQRDLLICVLYNLLKNALYAVHRAGRTGPGRITIIEGRRRNGADFARRVRVRDTGAGVAPGDLPRIFDQFFTTKPDCDGIGIGLWNTRHILRAHGGEIGCRSRAGSYTEFELLFPATPLSAARCELRAAGPGSRPRSRQSDQGSGQSVSRTVSRTLDSA